MAKIFTPSEKIRSNTNPQPVNPHTQSNSKRSNQLIFFKTLVGSPIPLLWLISSLSLISSYSLNLLGISFIAAFTLSYITLDLFSKYREFNIHRIGLEIPSLLLLLYYAVNFIMGNTANSQLPTEFLLLVVLIYSLSYSLNLFPGINKYFYFFMFCIPIFLLLALYQSISGFDPLLVDSPHIFSNIDLIPFSASGLSVIPEQFALMIASFSAFSLATAAISWRHNYKMSFAFIALTVIGLIAILFSQQLSIFLISISSFLIILFLVKKRYAIVVACLLSLLVWGFNNEGLATHKAFQQLSDQHQFHHNNSKNTQRLEFEKFTNNKWLGIQSKNSELFQFHKYSEMDSNFFKLNTFRIYLFNYGILFLIFLVSFCLSLIFLNLKLLIDVPKTHFWHRAFAYGILSFQIIIYSSALFYDVWGMSQIFCLYIFIISILCYMAESYSKGIIPDDRSI